MRKGGWEGRESSSQRKAKKKKVDPIDERLKTPNTVVEITLRSLLPPSNFDIHA